MSNNSIQTQFIGIDTDPQETAEWCDALASVLAAAGPQRARLLLDELARRARDPVIGWQPVHGTPYVNSIPVEPARC